MRIDGHWLLCQDGALRRVIKVEVESVSKELIEMDFLVDTGADRTVLSAIALFDLGLPAVANNELLLTGIGGHLEMVEIETALVFTADGNRPITFRSRFAAVTSFGALDMSIIGRDILNRFALIMDRTGDTICLLGQRHRYAITSH
ncbi:MAG: aspartyl protease family protein [Gemmatales bacterium]